MVPSEAPSLPTKEDHYLDEYYGGADLTELDEDAQASYCESMVSVVASGASDGVEVTCKVLGQEIIDNSAVQIEGGFGTSQGTHTLTINVSMKTVATNSDALKQMKDNEQDNL